MDSSSIGLFLDQVRIIRNMVVRVPQSENPALDVIVRQDATSQVPFIFVSGQGLKCCHKCHKEFFRSD
jgi:hypothetical protein